MLLKNKMIAIVGGGPGGVTLARLLQLKGAKVKVYERDLNKDARVQGSILDLHFPSGLKAIEKAGLMDVFRANYMPGADNYCIIDKHAKVVFGQQSERSGKSFGDPSFRPEIDRGILRKILLNSLQPGTVIWDSQFVKMAEVNNAWRLEFKNGTTAFADIVIGSDGAHSKIRVYVTDIEPRYAGSTIIQCVAENPEKDCPEIYSMINKGTLMSFGDRKSISLQQKADDMLTFYISARREENWIENCGVNFHDKQQVCVFLQNFFQGWNPIFFTLFKASANFIPRRLTYVPADQNWEARSNVTIIGDAAHIMPPSGEGVNLAMLDALELSECLTNTDFKDTQSAISAYENQMRTRASEELVQSLQLSEWMHSECALDKMLQMFGQI